jgi:hypothetical protein
MHISMDSNQPAWKQAYQQALFEIDAIELKLKLETAMKSVEDRLLEVRMDPTRRRELIELEDARRTIMFLQEHDLKT